MFTLKVGHMAMNHVYTEGGTHGHETIMSTLKVGHMAMNHVYTEGGTRGHESCLH